MPSHSLKTLRDCQDFLSGVRLFGTGGGGNIQSGMEMLEAALEEGLTLRWIDVSEMPEDAYSCTPFASGSISEDTPQCLADIESLGDRLGLKNKHGYRAIEVAVKELEEYAGVKIGAIVPVELGASNTPAPLVTGARLGVPVIDGDYSGRAVPQDMQTTYFLKGIKSYPAAIVDWWGNVVILKEAVNAEMGERIGKLLSVASYGSVYCASILLSASQTRDLVVPGTLTRSLELGKAIHEAVESGGDLVDAALKLLDGWLLFEGEVIEKEWEDKDGVMVGTTHLKGFGKNAGQRMDIWFLNENHVTWLDGVPYACSPDLIILADPNTGEGYTNTDVSAGMRVVVLGAPGYQLFRSAKGLEFFSPRYWGFDFDYTPIEKLVA